MGQIGVGGASLGAGGEIHGASAKTQKMKEDEERVQRSGEGGKDVSMVMVSGEDLAVEGEEKYGMGTDKCLFAFDGLCLPMTQVPLKKIFDVSSAVNERLAEDSREQEPE